MMKKKLRSSQNKSLKIKRNKSFGLNMIEKLPRKREREKRRS